MLIKVYKCKPRMKHPVIGWLIMLFQGMLPWKDNAWSHMAVSDYDIFYHMTGSGFKIQDKRIFEEKYEIIATEEMPIYEDVFNEWRSSIAKRKYDKLQILGLLFKAIGFVTFNKIGHNYKKLICSEAVLLLLKMQFNLDLKDSDSYDLISTWKLVEKYGE